MFRHDGASISMLRACGAPPYVAVHVRYLGGPGRFVWSMLKSSDFFLRLFLLEVPKAIKVCTHRADHDLDHIDHIDLINIVLLSCAGSA